MLYKTYQSQFHLEAVFHFEIVHYPFDIGKIFLDLHLFECDIVRFVDFPSQHQLKIKIASEKNYKTMVNMKINVFSMIIILL